MYVRLIDAVTEACALVRSGDYATVDVVTSENGFEVNPWSWESSGKEPFPADVEGIVYRYGMREGMLVKFSFPLVDLNI